MFLLKGMQLKKKQTLKHPEQIFITKGWTEAGYVDPARSLKSPADWDLSCVGRC